MSDEKEDVTLEDLPMHVLRHKLKERDITFKPTHKKVDLIKMLKTGETLEKPKKKEAKAHLNESKSKKSLPIVPDEIKPQLEAMAKRGLTWSINEHDCTITFKRGNMVSCANLDQSAFNILNTAREAFPKSAPRETGSKQPMEVLLAQQAARGG